MQFALSRVVSCLLAWIERRYLCFIQLPHSSFSLALVNDLGRSKPDLILENALLRRQLLIFQRQVNKPRFTRRVRLSLLLLASRLQSWRQALLILKPETVLRWHRRGFQLFWHLKTRTRRGRPRLGQDLVLLIQ